MVATVLLSMVAAALALGWGAYRKERRELRRELILARLG